MSPDQRYLTIRIPVPEAFLYNAERSVTGKAEAAFIEYMSSEAEDITRRTVERKLGLR